MIRFNWPKSFISAKVKRWFLKSAHQQKYGLCCGGQLSTKRIFTVALSGLCVCVCACATRVWYLPHLPPYQYEVDWSIKVTDVMLVCLGERQKRTEHASCHTVALDCIMWCCSVQLSLFMWNALTKDCNCEHVVLLNLHIVFYPWIQKLTKYVLYCTQNM